MTTRRFDAALTSFVSDPVTEPVVPKHPGS
jgi:hypothetical protein